MGQIAKCILAAPLALLSGSLAAQTFKCTDAAAKITYSSTKCSELGLKDAGEVKDRVSVNPAYGPSSKAPQAPPPGSPVFANEALKAQQPPERNSQGRPAGVSSGTVPIPRIGIGGDMEKSLEAQRPAWEAYQRCIRENEQAFKLSSITRTLIEVRNDKARYFALRNDPKTPARFKEKSYDEVVAEAMSEYRRIGGIARSIEEITPVPNPCAHVQPGPKLPPHRAEQDRKSPIAASASVRPIPTASQTEPSANQGPARTGWAKISESFASVLYVDPSSIKKVPKTDRSEKDEDIRQATQMIDFKIKAPDGPASYISTGEYDCKSGKTRSRSGNAYAGQAGTGRILNAITPSDWPPQPPTSPGTPILKYVCSKDLSLASPTPASR